MAQRGEMAEVELLEHDDAVDPVDHVARARGALRDRVGSVVGWVGRHRVLALGTAVVTVLAVAVPAVIAARADRERIEALATQPGFVAPMADAPDVGWTIPPSPGSYGLTLPGRAWIRDDVLVVWEQTGDFASSLRAIEVTTGDELWTAALSSVPDLGDLASRTTRDPTTCSAPVTAPGQGVVVCLMADSWQLAPSADGLQPDLVEAAAVRLRVFAAATGETLLEQSFGTDAALAAIGSDVVVVETPEAGPASLVRFDPATGTQRWRVDVPRPTGDVGLPSASVGVHDDEIAVPWLGTTALFTADGDVAGALDVDNVWRVREHRLTPETSAAAGMQLRDLDTGRVMDLGNQQPLWIDSDDGSEPDLLILQSAGRLSARSLTTGQLAWRVDWPSEQTRNLVVVDGMLARQSETGLTALDVATGHELWRRAAPAFGQSMVTDGRRLLVIELVVGTGPVVAAYDVRDGRRVWQVPVPVTVQSLAVVDHRLFALGSGGVVALGSEPG